MAYPSLAGPPSQSFGANRKSSPSGSWVEITMKPDQVMLGDFLPPAVVPNAAAFTPPPEAPPRPGSPRAGLHGERLTRAAPERRSRPPRLPEAICARLRRIGVEIVCIGFVCVVVLSVGYKLVHATLH
jgi:hypothetical protein